jgi:hypothetical protein
MKRALFLTFVLAAGWAACDTGTVPEESISTPDRPGGPEWLLWEDPTGTYLTGGAVSSLGHPVVYQFNWGDGFTSGWGPPERWTGWEWRGGVRRYIIRAQARCALHHDVLSPLSAALVVTIEEIESIPPDTRIANCPRAPIDYNTFAMKWVGSDNVTAPNKLQFSFFLGSVDSEWSPFLHDRERGLVRLPDGDYTFSVRAMDEAGNVDTTAAECAFTVTVSPQCSIDVTHPADGDVVRDSTLQRIRWRYAGDVYAVAIELYAGGAYMRTITLSTLNDGEHFWFVSSEYADTLDGLRFKVSDWNDPSCAGWSGVFSIAVPP